MNSAFKYCMFFHVGKHHQSNYSHFWKLGDFYISTDAGWQFTEFESYQAVFKGYCDDSVIDDGFLLEIMQHRFPGRTGNFCAFIFDTNTGTLSIKTDKYRSFPIYMDRSGRIGNLIPGGQTQWSDSVIWIDAEWNIMDAQWDIVAPTQPQAASVDQLHEYLTQKISTYFMYNPKPVKVFLTGGIDTLLIYSYIKKIDAPHVMVDGLYIEFDEFYLRNSFDIQAHRFYQQVHHWTSPSVLSSGAPGDEFMLRSPVTADLYLRNHGTSMRDQLRDHPDCYHYQYFTSAKNLAVFDKQAQEFVPRADLTRYLSNILVNDWQHWHLGNTLTWTPLRDLDITKMILNLPFELVRDQILDSAVSRQLIERNCPGLSGILSSQKNTGNLWQRFVDTILNHPK